MCTQPFHSVISYYLILCAYVINSQINAIKINLGDSKLILPYDFNNIKLVVNMYVCDFAVRKVWKLC